MTHRRRSRDFRCCWGAAVYKKKTSFCTPACYVNQGGNTTKGKRKRGIAPESLWAALSVLPRPARCVRARILCAVAGQRGPLGHRHTCIQTLKLTDRETHKREGARRPEFAFPSATCYIATLGATDRTPPPPRHRSTPRSGGPAPYRRGHNAPAHEAAPHARAPCALEPSPPMILGAQSVWRLRAFLSGGRASVASDSSAASRAPATGDSGASSLALSASKASSASLPDDSSPGPPPMLRTGVRPRASSATADGGRMARTRVRRARHPELQRLRMRWEPGRIVRHPCDDPWRPPKVRRVYRDSFWPGHRTCVRALEPRSMSLRARGAYPKLTARTNGARTHIGPDPG